MQEVKGDKKDILDVCEAVCWNGQIKGKTAENLLDFVNKIRKYSNEVSIKDHITLSKEIIYGVGYIESLQTEKTDESKSAIENINEFIRGLAEFSSLGEFLEYISLVNDKTNSTNDNSVNLMTIHSAKGLEFDLVFLPGWEEGVFPSPRSVDERNGLEEERRLAYVAITRAKNNLKISYSKTRYEYGEFKTTQVSRFIKELPEEYLETHNINFISQEELEDEDYSNSRVGRYRNYYQPKNFNKKDDDDFIISKDTPVKPLQNLAKRVLHPTFGEGVVIRKEGKKLTIAFKNGGLKTIIEDFVKILE